MSSKKPIKRNLRVSAASSKAGCRRPSPRSSPCPSPRPSSRVSSRPSPRLSPRPAPRPSPIHSTHLVCSEVMDLPRKTSQALGDQRLSVRTREAAEFVPPRNLSNHFFNISSTSQARASQDQGIEMKIIKEDGQLESKWSEMSKPVIPLISGELDTDGCIVVDAIREKADGRNRITFLKPSTLVGNSSPTSVVLQSVIGSLQVLGSCTFYLSLDSSSSYETKRQSYWIDPTLFFSAMLQMLVCVVPAYLKERQKLAQVHWPTFWYSFGAGVLWGSYEILTVKSVMLCSAGTASMIQQSRIVFTALLRMLLLGVPVSELHWHGMAMLGVSIVGCQFFIVQEDTLSLGEYTFKRALHEVRIGTVVCIFASMSYSLASVLTEKLYRDSSFACFSFEAKFLYIVSRKMVFLGVYCFIAWLARGRPAAFDGWTAKTIVVPSGLFLQTLTSHIALLRLNAIVSCLGEVLSAAIIYFIECAFFGKGFRPVELCFMILVLQSIAIFVRITSKLDKVDAQNSGKFQDWANVVVMKKHIRGTISGATEFVRSMSMGVQRSSAVT